MNKPNIPFVDLKLQNTFFRKKFIRNLDNIIKNSNYIKGKNNKLLEKKICKIFKCKYSLNVNSGTDALIVGIRSLNLKYNSEIITTSNTWISSAYAIELNNCKPVFVDVDPDTFQINCDLLKRKINKKTKAIIVTHLYGNPNNMNEICKIAKKYKLFIIEDIAQAHLATYNKKIVGNFGDVACLSFYPSKNLGALGDAGNLITNSKKIYNQAVKFANYGSFNFKDINHSIIGINSRMDELQASFLLEKINYLKKDTKKRIKLAKEYNFFCKKINLQNIKVLNNSTNVYHLYPIIVKNRDKIKKKLKIFGINTQIHYEIPIHLQTAFKHLNYKKGSLPITEYLSKNILSLPFYPGIEKRKIKYMFNILRNLTQ